MIGRSGPPGVDHEPVGRVGSGVQPGEPWEAPGRIPPPRTSRGTLEVLGGPDSEGGVMSHYRGRASVLSHLFAPRVFHELGRNSRSPVFTRLMQQTRLLPLMSPDSTVGDAFERAFGILRQSGMRDEYVYRSAIAQKILLGRHSLNTATMLNELRAGECKADVVVLNGTSTAYEIKSDRDSLTRLTNQLSNYRAVFASVNVVVGHSHLDDVLTLVPHDVGVLLLTNRFRLSVVREAIDLPERTSPLMILEILRIDEAASILRNLGLEAPEVPNTRIRTEFKDIFIGLDPGVVHKQMVEVLR